MPTKKEVKVRTDDEVRQILLEYFYSKNKSATSRKGKKTGAAVPISVIRKDLKSSHNLSIHEIHSNLTYLLSEGWVEEQTESRAVPIKSGSIVPSSTSYFIITSAGIDKIAGPSEFSRDHFQGIKIEATGQNIITLGDGNQINAEFSEVGNALASLKDAVRRSTNVPASQQLELIADINTLESQLVKSTPDRNISKLIWDKIHQAASAVGLAGALAKAVPIVQHFLSR